MITAIPSCPRCGSEDTRPRAIPANVDVGEAVYFVCDLCGEQIGPVQNGSDLASLSLELTRPAAKPSRDLVSRSFAVLKVA